MTAQNEAKLPGGKVGASSGGGVAGDVADLTACLSRVEDLVTCREVLEFVWEAARPTPEEEARLGRRLARVIFPVQVVVLAAWFGLHGRGLNHREVRRARLELAEVAP